MKLLVDADACPVKEIIIETGKKFSLPVWMFTDTCHQLEMEDAVVHIVDKAKDSADFALVNAGSKGDIAVTQDYGLASMLLGKGIFPIHPNGFCFDDSNIDRLLFDRYLSTKQRHQKKFRGSKFHPRTEADNDRFRALLQKKIVDCLDTCPFSQ